MSSSYTNTGSESYSKTDVKNVLGKIYDDFHAIAARGFDFIEDHPDYLENLRDDLYYIMIHEDLKMFQFQFDSHGKREAVEYQVLSDGTVQQDSDSGGIDYWDFDRSAKIRTVVRRHGNKKVSDYLVERGWSTGGSFVEGREETVGSYSSGNLDVTKKIIR